MHVVSYKKRVGWAFACTHLFSKRESRNTSLEFEISVIVICLLFEICYLDFFRAET